jgi:DNA-binding transcriptional LysR family regulator
MIGGCVLDLHRLRLLRELRHRGTLAAVADALTYTPSAISQQLSVLEAEAGVPLLERSGRSVRLTPAAERLVEHTEAILERLEQARADLDASAARIGGTVRIAAFHTTAHAVIPAALSALASAHPALRVEVTEREPEASLPGLIAHEFDLALLEEYPGHPQRRRPELDYRQLATDPMRLAQPASAPRALADLAGHPWILEPPGTAARHWATAVCRAAGFEPDVRYQSTDLLLHLRLVRTGHAVALLPGLLSASRSAAGQSGAGQSAAGQSGADSTHADPPIHLSDLPGSPARHIYAATRRGAGQHPALAAVRQALATAIQTSSGP